MYESTFLKYLQFEKRFSSHTLTAYRSDLSQFFTFLSDPYELVRAEDINHHHVRAWVIYLLSEDVAASSVRRKLSVLKTYFRFLMKQGLITANPMSRVLIPKTGKRLPEFVSEKAMHELLHTLEWPQGFAGLRDRVIIEMLYHTGMRRGELLSLTPEKIDLKQQLIRVLGKGHKERLIPFSQPLKEILATYLAERTDQVVSGVSALIITDKGEAAYPKYIYNVVKRYLGQVTTLEKRSPHTLRHTFATHLTDHGADLNAVKSLLGHASLAATQIYTHNSIERLKKVYEQAHPKGKK